MATISWVIFIIHLVSSFMMIGIIWLVQIINYPLFALVPEQFFKEYHKKHLTRSQWIIVPLMLIELLSGFLLLFWYIPQVSYWLYLLNFFLIFLVWIETFLIQAPKHNQLQASHSQKSIEQLVNLNWLRTITWSLHGLVLIKILY